MKKMQSAGVVVYHLRNNELYYLLLHYVAGHWDFPKGKIEKGETKQQAALRELQEEAGIDAKLHDGFEKTISYFFKDYDGQPAHKTVYFFVGKAQNNTVILSHEHIHYAWLSFEQALHRLTYDNAKEILKEAHQYVMEQKEKK